MNIDKTTWIKLQNKAKEWYYQLRNDAEALVEIRKLTLGFMVGFGILYAGNALYLEPQEKNLAQRKKQQQELRATTPAQLGEALAGKLKKLTTEKTGLEDKIAILKLQEQFHAEQWQEWGNLEKFTKSVFTLHDNAPVNIEDNLQQMSQLENRSQNGFTVHPLNLSGQVEFSSLYN